MHFYHWTWDDMMRLNLRLFWTCLKQMYRIQAAENMRFMQLLGMPHADEDTRKKYWEEQNQRLGQTMVSDERDEEGIAKLRNMM